jgi:hypothetical protein
VCIDLPTEVGNHLGAPERPIGKMKRRFVGMLVPWILTVAGCATTAGPSDTALRSVPSGWAPHDLNGVSLASPMDWRVGRDPVCAPVPTHTIGIITSDEHDIPTGGAVAIGVTSCPNERVTTPHALPTSAWVSIECVITPRVALPNTVLGTSGSVKVVSGGSDPFYVIGQGQAVEVDAGTDPVAQEILRTITPTAHHC